MKTLYKIGIALLTLFLLTALVLAPPPPWVTELRSQMSAEQSRLNSLPRNIEINIELVVPEPDKTTYFYRVEIYNATRHEEDTRMIVLRDMWVDRNSSTNAFIQTRIYDEGEAKARNYVFPVISNEGGALEGQNSNRGRVN